MSEYQYYEFQAIDKPLDEEALDELGRLSSRAIITPTSFVNEYNYGDFRGNPLKLMEKYFDAFIYVTNWGIRKLMFKIPKSAVDFEQAKAYCLGENSTFYEKKEHLIFEFSSHTEDYDWEEGEGWLSSLISLRSDLLNGDLRCLYLGWLSNIQYSQIDDEIEPSIPPNLQNLSGPLKSFADFIRLDDDLIHVASENSVSEDVSINHSELAAWIAKIPEKDKNSLLYRLINRDNPHLPMELKRRFLKETSDQKEIVQNSLRTIEELRTKAEVYYEEQKRISAEKKAAEKARREKEEKIGREKYLNSLASKETETWATINENIAEKKASAYDQAVTLLVDLYDLSKRNKKEKEFIDKMKLISEEHCKKQAFIRRLKEVGLLWKNVPVLPNLIP